MSDESPPERPAWSWRSYTWQDFAAAGALVLLAAWFLHVTWRKWPDPLIDVGAQLYVPWRLSEGAVLFRDLEALYGPLSQYFNSLIFRIAGASLNVLIATNLAIYAAIVGLLYHLVRSGWGRLVATIGCAIFIAVFSFSRLSQYGGYNYVTPYSQEVTHGILQLLVLVWILRGWLERPHPWRLVLAGIVAGLSALLKPEFMLASAVVAAAAFVLHWKHRRTPAGIGRSLGGFILGGMLPALAATGLFRLADGVDWSHAWRYANNAWLMALENTDIVSSQLSAQWMGLDHPWRNLFTISVYGGGIVLFAFGIGWLSRSFTRLKAWSVALGAAALAGVVFALPLTDWTRTVLENVGMLIPGLLILAAVGEYLRYRGTEGSDTDRSASRGRMLLGLAAVAMLFRMILFPRIHHYGFFQAALAGVVAVATLLTVVPQFLQLAATPRRYYQWIMIGLVLATTGRIAASSRLVNLAVDYPIAAGTSDAFYAVAPEIDPTGKLVEAARQFLVNDPGAHTLLVLPEGAMINYLARIPSSISEYVVFVPAAGRDRMARALQELEASPPDRIALITRSLTEYGVDRFGDSVEHGADIIRFLTENYDPNPVFYADGGEIGGRKYAVVIWARLNQPVVPVR